ncbi:MAG: hypothetical protein FJW40_13670 [Acidobacteria bacterium]|nr:hypothetical protein [Acidobacteriota bacterium]
MRLLVTGVLAAACSAYGQFSGGLIGGVGLSEPVTGFKAKSNNYIVGGTTEIGLPAGLAIEGDLLFKRLGSVFYSAGGTGPVREAKAYAVDVPILGKLYLGRHLLLARPYVAGGITLRRLFGTSESSGAPPTFSIRPLPSFVFRRADVSETFRGTTFAAGIRINALVLKISPEIRITKWGDQGLPINTKQAEFLVSLRF